MRVANFNGGPGALPREVLEEAARDLLDWNGTGMSVMENSHRGPEVQAMAAEAEADFRALLGLNGDWAVIFCQGGASLQFAMIPLNFAGPGGRCDYINTGLWSTKAFKEARICGANPRLAASSEDDDFTHIPEVFDFDPEAKYVYITSNNTVRGTQWSRFPHNAPGPLVADMSSELLSRPLDLRPFGLIYGGAQKNIGPAGLTVVAIRRELADKARLDVPSMLSYPVYIKNQSMYNTPPVWSLYVSGLTFKWLLNTVGGLNNMAALNQAKSDLLYQAIDDSQGYYRGTARPGSRSVMNVTYRLPGEELEKKFKKESQAAGLVGLGGHRSVGGLRASLYNAVTLDDVRRLVDFMAEFQRVNG
ncbi:MAG: 3-phosphoserine/phosphohydroxythreonine transaminase [Candidatus Adiutrix sp.]|jgi:phosphoserine aminotransferase|nr:3-phosphoserine/phosphohydroxythreonine transaminase [Candidatus Adiutrix sp.]